MVFLPHLFILAVQLFSFHLISKKLYRDRFIIGALFIGLIIISFISNSILVESTVLLALSLALIVRAQELKNNNYLAWGLVLMIALIGFLGYFIYSLSGL